MNQKPKKMKTKDRQRMFIEMDMKNGFGYEEYKDLKFLTQHYVTNGDVRYWLKVYRGNCGKTVINMLFRTNERMTQKINEQKSWADSREAYKAKRKLEGKTLSTAAECAKRIREELKFKFPGVKFSVTSDNFSMGNSVDVRWTDGPTYKEVDDFVSRYQYGHFDGMTDMYEYSNTRKDIPQAKFVMCNRSMSDVVMNQIRKENTLPLDSEWDKMRDCWGSNSVYRIFNQNSY